MGLYRRSRHQASLYGIALCAVASNVTAKQPIGGPDYLAIVPPDWKLLSEGAISHERGFVSSSGDAWLSLYARPPGASIEAHLERVRHQNHERITYERRGATWIVVSGYNGDRIFYRKAMLACFASKAVREQVGKIQQREGDKINRGRLGERDSRGPVFEDGHSMSYECIFPATDWE